MGWNYLYQDLMQAFSGLLDGPRMICCNIPCSSWKRSTWSKGKGSPSPHNCCLIIVLQYSDKKFLHSGFARKQVTTKMAGLPVKSGHNNNKTIIPTCRSFDVQLYAKNEKIFISSFFRYCKDICKPITLSTLRMLDHAQQ